MPAAQSSAQENPYLTKKEDGVVVTEQGKEFLAAIVTDPVGPVYVFTHKAPPILVAGAMARLSRRGSDLREIYLDEFACVDPEKAEGVIRRVVTGFGDDSVQQLLSVSLAVEGASNLLTKRLEWGRLAAYLEQSTRYIYFDQKDASGKYRFFTPVNLRPKLTKRYNTDMTRIFSLYSRLVRQLTGFVRRNIPEPENKKERIAWLGATRAQACDAARPTLPAATTSTVGIVAPAQSIESLILTLAADPLPEAQKTALSILNEVRKVAGVFFERTDMPERGGAKIAYTQVTRSAIDTLVARYTPDVWTRDAKRQEVTLVDFWPKDELSLASEILFSRAQCWSMEEIQRAVSRLCISTREEILRTAIGERLNRRHRPGRAFEKAHYEWLLTIDYGIFRDLQRHRMIDMPEWQRLTTLYGYEIPKLVTDAGMDELYKECFSISDGLYMELVRADMMEESQYATLLGHRMNFRLMENAREAYHFHELRTSPQGHPGYRRVVQEMHRQMAVVHPIIAGGMRFINMGEDPELTRMAGELATQRKLALLQGETNG